MSAFKNRFAPGPARTRLWGLVLALGIFAGLPVPGPDRPDRLNLALSALWFCVAGLCASLWNRPRYVAPWWFAAVIVSFVVGKFGAGHLPLVLLAAWFAWFGLRRKRTGALAFALALSTTAAWGQVSVRVEGANDPGADDIVTSVRSKKKLPPAPKYLTGYGLADVSSCSAIDQVPWKFRPDRRKTRLLVRDTLRLSTEPTFETWEVNQVMDGQGYVTYVFSKMKNGRRVESLLIKDNVFNRVVEKNGVSKVVEVQDLRTLINRPVVSLAHPDGSTVVFSPGLAGQSVLTVELRQAVGRPLAPLYVRGSFCERAQGETNSVDLLGGSGTGTAAPAAASGFGGSQ